MADRYGLEIRSATAADAADLAELIGELGPPVSHRAMADRIEAVRRDAGAVLLAVEWGPPSGLVALSWRPSLHGDAPTAQITTLLVRPDARRRGVARLLLKPAAQAARMAGCGALQLAVSPDQNDLQAFCRATGFTESGMILERALRKRA